MNDRELLELAAKAAGRGSQWWMESQWNGADREWNPLTDDGDALRLAVELEIDLIVGTGSKFVVARYTSFQLNDYFYTQDKLNATRRAIVRAAAEIGKGMK